MNTRRKRTDPTAETETTNTNKKKQKTNIKIQDETNSKITEILIDT